MKHYNKDELSAYLDNEGLDATRGEIDAHLEICEQCREEVDSWLSLRSLLAKTAEPEFSEDFVTDVMNRVAPALEHPESRGMLSSLAQWLIPGLEFAFALVLLGFFGSYSASNDVDSEMVLLAGLQGEVVQEEFSPLPLDLSTMLGVQVEEL